MVLQGICGCASLQPITPMLGISRDAECLGHAEDGGGPCEDGQQDNNRERQRPGFGGGRPVNVGPFAQGQWPTVRAEADHCALIWAPPTRSA
jgi:hypothetical protein